MRGKNVRENSTRAYFLSEIHDLKDHNIPMVKIVCPVDENILLRPKKLRFGQWYDGRRSLKNNCSTESLICQYAKYYIPKHCKWGKPPESTG